MSPAYDTKQWRQACREVGLARGEIHQAKRDFHAEKQAFGERGHWPDRKLINWLRSWREERWQP